MEIFELAAVVSMAGAMRRYQGQPWAEDRAADAALAAWEAIANVKPSGRNPEGTVLSYLVACGLGGAMHAATLDQATDVEVVTTDMAVTTDEDGYEVELEPSDTWSDLQVGDLFVPSTDVPAFMEAVRLGETFIHTPEGDVEIPEFLREWAAGASSDELDELVRYAYTLISDEGVSEGDDDADDYLVSDDFQDGIWKHDPQPGVYCRLDTVVTVRDLRTGEVKRQFVASSRGVDRTGGLWATEDTSPSDGVENEPAHDGSATFRTQADLEAQARIWGRALQGDPAVTDETCLVVRLWDPEQRVMQEVEWTGRQVAAYFLHNYGLRKANTQAVLDAIAANPDLARFKAQVRTAEQIGSELAALSEFEAAGILRVWRDEGYEGPLVDLAALFADPGPGGIDDEEWYQEARMEDMWADLEATVGGWVRQGKMYAANAAYIYALAMGKSPTEAATARETMRVRMTAFGPSQVALEDLAFRRWVLGQNVSVLAVVGDVSPDHEQVKIEFGTLVLIQTGSMPQATRRAWEELVLGGQEAGLDTNLGFVDLGNRMADLVGALGGRLLVRGTGPLTLGLLAHAKTVRREPGTYFYRVA